MSNLLYLLLLLITCLSCGIEKLYVSWYDIELRNVNLQKEADSVTFKLRQKKKKKPKKKKTKKKNKQKKNTPYFTVKHLLFDYLRPLLFSFNVDGVRKFRM